MYNSHMLIAGRPWVAVIHKTSKTAPQSSPKAGKILKKVAESAEIPKSAPLTTAKQPENSQKK